MWGVCKVYYYNKSYDKNKTSSGENCVKLVADSIVFAIVFQVLFRIP